MAQAANTYAQALYDLTKEEGIGKTVLEELAVLQEVFRENPAYSKLLSAPDLSKRERCGLLDAALRGKVHPYVLNFLKLLTEKGYIRSFSRCCEAYGELYNEDNGILAVKAVSAETLTPEQTGKLKTKLEAITGKHIDLRCSVDAATVGGLRLCYGGVLVDGTVKAGLEAIGRLLRNTVL